jgi:orotate phosphoribosyltransferase
MSLAPLAEELLAQLSAKAGHFRFESGHHGDLWLDLDALFLRPGSLRRFVQTLARSLSEHRPTAVCGPQTGGAFLAFAVAAELDVEFLFAERLAPSEYEQEGPVRYRVPRALRQTLRDHSVAVVDDVINAGSAVRGTLADLRSGGARPVAIGALLVLGDSASALAAAEGLPLASLASRPNNLWLPEHCPLCAAGRPVE